MTSMDKISLYLLLYVLIYFQIGANAGLIHNPFNAGSALSQSALQALDHFTKASIGFVIPRNEYSSSLMYMNPSIHRDFPLGLNQSIHILDFKGNGTLPPVLLLHGISSCAVDYLPLVWHLRGECSRVICIDLPSHGLSVSSSSLTLDQLQVIMVEAVRAVLDHLDIQRVLLAGNSLGGMVAARYASKYSKSLAGLILLSPAGAPLSNAELNEIKESFDIKTLSDGSVFVDKVLGRRSVPFGIRHFMGWAARERAARPSVRAILTQADLQMKIQEAELRGIKCPILLVWGEREKLLHHKHRDWWISNLPSKKLQVFRPQLLGHIPHFDSAYLTGAMVAFCQQCI